MPFPYGQRTVIITMLRFAILGTVFGWPDHQSKANKFQVETKMKISRRVLLLASFGTLQAPPQAYPETRAPAGAYLYIIWPKDGDRVKGGFWCRFGLRNMGITRAGDPAPNTGHHHLLIDVAEPPSSNQLIPSDKNHLHFGAGQTEAYLQLPPGEHTLQLVLGDAEHRVFSPPIISKKIKITVLGV
jgi:hypothetical protein